MTKKEEELKEQFLQIIESKIVNNTKPVLEYDEEKGVVRHWLNELWKMAHVAGEITAIKSCKAILSSDLHELDNIEELGQKELKNKNTLQ